METFTLTFTEDEINMLWGVTMQNMEYWQDEVFRYGNKRDLFIYRIARTSFAKIHRLLPTAIIRNIKGVAKNKYKLTIIRKGV